MRDKFIRRGRMRTGRSQDTLGDDHCIGRECEIETRLSTTEQFEIDSGEELTIDLGPVLDSHRKIDREAATKRIKTCRRPRKADARQAQRIDKRVADRLAFEQNELGI